MEAEAAPTQVAGGGGRRWRRGAEAKVAPALEAEGGGDTRRGSEETRGGGVTEQQPRNYPATNHNPHGSNPGRAPPGSHPPTRVTTRQRTETETSTPAPPPVGPPRQRLHAPARADEYSPFPRACEQGQFRLPSASLTASRPPRLHPGASR
uniref:Uncharacterized protein n=1 Tax=Oryza sativa subsp. japonica TaxID=39947 RepID=Q7Y154_ORYSJ|nr:hypothetical protein [Oryza sativa Japonica Group]